MKANASAVFTGRADRKTTIGRAIRWHAVSRFARPAIRDDGHRLIKGTATLLVALLVSTLLWSILFVLPAGAELSETGPVDPETGFPAWLEDGRGCAWNLVLPTRTVRRMVEDHPHGLLIRGRCRLLVRNVEDIE